jgi:hypothetical protein
MTIVQRIYLKVIAVWVATLAALYAFQMFYTR